jgi:hypothetical protein
MSTRKKKDERETKTNMRKGGKQQRMRVKTRVGQDEPMRHKIVVVVVKTHV